HIYMEALIRQELEQYPETIRVVGVKVRDRGEVKKMAAGTADLLVGDRVMLQREEHLTYGVVYTEPQTMPFLPPMRVMTSVWRKATPEEDATIRRHESIAIAGLAYCKERAAALRLSLKMVEVFCSFINRQITFVYTSEDRVDFRQLVKDLARRFHARVEMRHIGVRQEAQMLSGVDTCGLVLCCATFLTDLRPVNFKKTLSQDLNLTDSRLIGVCGRLKCCLLFESDEFMASRGSQSQPASLIHPTRPTAPEA
ncbi:MAG: regulatory iron-sulfur-containing complex subunit RicT, partial [Nitrospirales bacterium]